VKATWLDIVVNTGTFIVLALASFLTIYFGLRPLTIPFFGDYHVLVDGLAGVTLYGILSAVLLRCVLLIWPLRAGEYVPDQLYCVYWRWLTVTYHFGLKALRPVTTDINIPLILKMFGAKIGPGVVIGGRIDTPFFVTMGGGSVLGNNSVVSGDVVSSGKIILGPVQIGNGVTIGANSVVFPRVEIGHQAVLQVGTVAVPGTRIPSGENWRGNPARKWMGE
jgi:serine acetyltransferase